jgi:hypothetical protein
MVPASPDTAPVEAEFDLDVRLQAVARHVPADPAMKPSDQCPDSPTNITCHPQGGCME